MRGKQMSDRQTEVTPTERAAIITLALAEGKELEPEQIADMTECDLSTAYKVLKRISRVIPLAEFEGRWSLLRAEDLNFIYD